MSHPSEYPGVERPSCEESLVSVVLPVYNEAKVLPVLAARIASVLTSCSIDYEIIFVNDGSCDDSPQVLDQLAATCDRVRVVHLSRNFGVQAALQAGLVRASGDAVVLMNANMQDPPEAIPRFLTEWHGGCDIVYAVYKRPNESVLNRLLRGVFRRVAASLASAPIPPNAGIFGLIDRRVARHMITLGERDRFFPGLRSWVGFRQKGVPVDRCGRYGEPPHVSLVGLLRSAKKGIVSASSFPLAMFHVIGVVALAAFVALSGFAICCKLFTDGAIPGWTCYLLAASFFGAINALAIGILGEYAVRIYDQVRGRPAYLVDRTVNFSASPPEDAGDAPYAELLQEATEMLRVGNAGRREERPGAEQDEADWQMAFTCDDE
jgi:dolichol-phosphate mannosyltransferase